jgi:hypothetical protein
MTEQVRQPPPPAPSANDAGGSAAQAEPAAPSATVKALLGLVQATYRPGAVLTDAERARLRTTIEAMQAASTALHAYPLTNADEPDPIFAAFRAE